MEDIEDIILELENEVANGKKAFFGNGVVLDPDVIFAIADRMRNNLPGCIRDARIILANSEKRRQEETERAQKIIATAQKRADEILSDHKIILQAQNEAEAIREQANEYYAKIMNEVRREVVAFLSDSEKVMLDTIETLKAKKEQLLYNNGRR